MDDFQKKGSSVLKENIWNEECEALLAEWSEKASCYRWLHGRSEKIYRKRYYSFSIPVIILSTLTGAANVGMDSFVPAESKSLASAIVGAVNIFAGIISTLQNFLKVAEYMEAHRIAGVSWGKLQRNIAIELALDPSRRVIQSDFLKLSRAEYDRLIEAGPIIDDKVIGLFNKKFKNYEVSVPSICNGLDKCNIYKKDPNYYTPELDFQSGIEDQLSDEEKFLQKKYEDTVKSEEKIKKMEKIVDDLDYQKNKLSESENQRTKLDNDDINNMVDFVKENKDEDEELLPREDKECKCDKEDKSKKNIEVIVDDKNDDDVDDKTSVEENNNINDFLDDIK